jgi:large-conductance mechanosensitive channel
MVKLSSHGLKWLKGFHLLTVAFWVGGGFAMLMLYFLNETAIDGQVLFGINKSIHMIDIGVVVIPGAFGCLITGLIYSTFSSWGFFKHKWIIFKWIVTVGAILMGMFFLGPWETTMMELSGDLGISALKNEEYQYVEKMGFIFGTVQFLLLAVTIFISIFKPWECKKQKTNN